MTDTFISRLNENEEALEWFLALPDSMLRQLPRKRREELFEPLWEHTSMDRVEVMNAVNQRELEFVGEHEGTGVPDWMLRCEAQSLLMEAVYKRFEEEGLV